MREWEGNLVTLCMYTIVVKENSTLGNDTLMASYMFLGEHKVGAFLQQALKSTSVKKTTIRTPFSGGSAILEIVFLTLYL